MTYGDLAIIFAGLGVTFLAATSVKPGQRWRNVYRLAVAIAVPIMTLAVVLQNRQTTKTEQARQPNQARQTSAWKEGDCFTLDYGFHKERWDGPPSVYRIEEVGIAKYRVSIYLDKGWRESVLDTRKSDAIFMRKSNCPGGGHGS